ncbi:M96 mating-specific protein family, partial [Globisporangium splendens]
MENVAPGGYRHAERRIQYSVATDICPSTEHGRKNKSGYVKADVTHARASNHRSQVDHHGDVYGTQETWACKTKKADANPKMKPQAFIGLLLGALAVTAIRTAPASAALSDDETVIVTGSQRIYGNDAYPVYYRRAVQTSYSRARYPGFNHTTRVLKAGTIRREGAKVLPCDIVFERDVAVTLRDGTTIYTDVFRPVNANATYPALIAWSPYGKEVGSQWLDDTPGRSRVPLSAVSELQKFEGPDPAYWVNQGYVVLNPDTRGGEHSEGNITYWGRQLAEDGYDFVEWAAKQQWSSGKVAFSGNSWLAASQWFIAAEQPPHLAAIAPWEGLTDLYRHVTARGGLPNLGFSEAIATTLPGNNFVEDSSRMTLKESLITPYWEDKIARLSKINVPAYVVASYSNQVHTHGTFEGFRHISSTNKWLRVHNSSEWPDYYTEENVEDLRRFFDRYLKGIDNGWEKTTPRVRLAVLNPGGEDQLNVPAADWPVPGVKEQALYLQDNNVLGSSKPSSASNLTYSATAEGGVSLLYTIPEDMSIVGYIKVRLWVEAVGSDDMDLAAIVQKVGANGNPYPNTVGGESAPTVSTLQPMRVSLRHLDPVRSTPSEPYQTFDRVEKLRAGEIVPVEIGLWPTAMKFTTGERLQLVITPTVATSSDKDLGFGVAVVPIPADGGTFVPGTNVTLLELGGGVKPAYADAQRVPTPASANNGTHVIHFGGEDGDDSGATLDAALSFVDEYESSAASDSDDELVRSLGTASASQDELTTDELFMDVEGLLDLAALLEFVDANASASPFQPLEAPYPLEASNPAVENAAAKKLHKKPTRLDPNKWRNTRKQEMIYLRNKVSELEAQLRETHKQKKPRSWPSPLRHHVHPAEDRNGWKVRFSVPLSAAGSSFRPTAVSVWKEIADSQSNERMRSERENTRLKLLLGSQLRIANNLQKLLNKSTGTRGVHNVHPPTANWTTDSQIFDYLLAGVPVMYSEIDAVLAVIRLAQSEAPRVDAKMLTDESHGQVMEVFGNKVFPFDIHTTGAAVWDHFVSMKERIPYRHYYHTTPKKINAEEDTILENCILDMQLNQTSGRFHIKQILRRYVERDRVVVIWRACFNPVELSGEPITGVQFVEKGFIVVKRPKINWGNMSLLQTCYIAKPELTGDMKENPLVKSMLDFVLRTTAGNITASHQMIENELLEQMLRTSNRVS